MKNYVPVTDEMLRNPPAGDWLMARRVYQGTSYSPLNEITAANVKDLRLAWVWNMNEGGANQTMPLVHNGIMYLWNTGNIIQALDAKTGESDLGERSRAARARRLRLDAQHRDLPGQDRGGDHRRADRHAERDQRQEGLGDHDRRSHEGLLEHERTDRREGQGHTRPAGMHAIRARSAVSSARTT